MQMPLFVYGTLKTGGQHFDMLRPYLLAASDAMAFGKIYQIDGKPALVCGESFIQGQLLFLADEKESIDKVGKFLGKDYSREEIVVSARQHAVPATTYIYGHKPPKKAIPASDI